MFRADRVYRTGVIPPLAVVNPGYNVQTVAQAFTDRGSSLQLNGAPLSWYQRLKLRGEAKRAGKRAAKMLKRFAALPPELGGPTLMGLHGPVPGRLRMENMAVSLAINPPMPEGARTYLQAGSQIIPVGTSLPQQLAYEATAKAPPMIAARAGALGFRGWLNPRRGRFDRRG